MKMISKNKPDSNLKLKPVSSINCLQPSSPSNTLAQMNKQRSKLFPAAQISYLNKQLPCFKKMMPKSDCAYSSLTQMPESAEKQLKVPRSRNQLFVSSQKVTIGDIDDVPGSFSSSASKSNSKQLESARNTETEPTQLTKRDNLISRFQYSNPKSSLDLLKDNRTATIEQIKKALQREKTGVANDLKT